MRPKPDSRRRTSGLTLVLAVLLAACASGLQVQANPPASSHGVALSQDDIAIARRFRQAVGLRSDEPWIRTVAADPSATVAYGVPLTPAEKDDLDRRAVQAPIVVAVVERYGSRHPSEWAGVHIDQTRGGLVVARFTARLEEHRRAIQALLGPDARFEVLLARWTTAELGELAERVVSERGWLATIGAAFINVGVHVDENLVVLRISSANPRASEQIVTHLAAQDRLRVESDGTGAKLLPPGTLQVTAVDALGRPVPDLDCVPIPDVVGAYEGDIGYSTTAQGICQIPVRASGYVVRLWAAVGTQLVEVGHGYTVVPPYGVGQVRIVVHSP